MLVKVLIQQLSYYRFDMNLRPLYQVSDTKSAPVENSAISQMKTVNMHILVL